MHPTVCNRKCILPVSFRFRLRVRVRLTIRREREVRLRLRLRVKVRKCSSPLLSTMFRRLPKALTNRKLAALSASASSMSSK